MLSNAVEAAKFNAVLTPSAAQMEAYEWMLWPDLDAPLVCLNIGDQGSGKTDGAAVALLRLARLLESQGWLEQRYMLLGRTMDAADRNITRYLRNAAKMLGYEGIFERKRGYLEFGDAEFHFFGANDERALNRLQGFSGVAGIVDEITRFKGEWGKEVFEYATGRLREGPEEHRRLIATGNPHGPTHWVKTDWWDEESGQSCVRIEHDVRLRPGMTASAVAKMEANLSGANLRRLMHREWASDEGLIWENARELPEARAYRRIEAGVDAGFKHATAAVFIGETADGEWDVIGEYWAKARERSFDEHADLMVGIGQGLADEFGLAKVSRWHVPPDPATKGLDLELKKGRGERLPVKVRQADNRVDPGLEAVRQAFNSGKLKLVSGRSPKLKWEVAGYAMDPRENYDKPKKENDDACDGLRYAVMGLRRPGALYVERV